MERGYYYSVKTGWTVQMTTSVLFKKHEFFKCKERMESLPVDARMKDDRLYGHFRFVTMGRH